MSSDAELERFKTAIDLVHFAQSLGYVLDRTKSCKTSATLRCGDDTIVVFPPGEDHHWTYWNRADEADHGSIIDLLQKRRRLSLGQVRKELRAWTGAATGALTAAPSLRAKKIDRQRVQREFAAAKLEPNSAYLNERGISAETLALPIFAGTFRVDRRGNVLFPHVDLQGLCGFDIKSAGWTRFSAAGAKGLWQSNSPESLGALIITESPIDAISYHQLFSPPFTQYFSTGGTLSRAQADLLKTRIAEFKRLREVLLAFDSDAGGEVLARAVAQLLPGIPCALRLPPAGQGAKDWNDILRSQSLGLKT